MTDTTPIETGDRFEDTDARSGERTIRIIAVEPDDQYRYIVTTYVRMPWEVNVNPDKARGRRISGKTLRTRYTRISR